MVVDKQSPIPLYSQVKAWLEQEIDSGRLAPGSRMPSELELAAQYGISRTTARQALQKLSEAGMVVRIQGKGTFVRAVDEATPNDGNGDDTKVDSNDKDPVERTQPVTPSAPRLRPRQAVRLLQYRDGDDILFDRHYQNLVRGVEREARERHLDIVLSSCLECEQDLDHVLASRCESGLVLYGEFENGFAGRVARRGVPAVAIDDAANGHDSLDTVRVDYFRAAYDATKHLIDLGHRTIAYMGGSRMCDRGDIKEWKASVLRRDGFLQAMADASLQVLEDHVRVEFGTQRHALRGARRLFDRIHKPTAVVCFSPSIALGVELAATEKGLDIPRDLSLLTFSECEQVYFRGDSNFTTVWADAYEAGRTSLRLLQARIQNPTRPPQTVTIPSQLYPGDTCAKPASR